MSTNVTRLLDAKSIKYTLYEYESDGSLDGMKIAEMQGQNPPQVLKTIIVEDNSKKLHVCCVPVTGRIDLKKAASEIGVKKVKLFRSEKLKETVGYVHGACSPMCLKVSLPVYVDASTECFEEVYVSAGEIGKQVKIAMCDLKALTGFQFKALV